MELIDRPNVGAGNGIDNGAEMDQGPGVGTGDGMELAEGPGLGTGDGPKLDERPADCAGPARWADQQHIHVGWRGAD